MDFTCHVCHEHVEAGRDGKVQLEGVSHVDAPGPGCVRRCRYRYERRNAVTCQRLTLPPFAWSALERLTHIGVITLLSALRGSVVLLLVPGFGCER